MCNGSLRDDSITWSLGVELDKDRGYKSGRERLEVNGTGSFCEVALIKRIVEMC